MSKQKCRGVLIIVLGIALGGCGQRTEVTKVSDAEISGQTACYIFVQGDCHGWVPPFTWFADDFNGASWNEPVCLHRAGEYAQWCGLASAGDQVNAAFNMDGVT